MTKQRRTIEILGKSFTFEPDTESELEAYTAARAYLAERHQQRVAAIAPAPGSGRLLMRTYEDGNVVPTPTRAAPKKEDGNVVLTPAPAALRKKGS